MPEDENQNPGMGSAGEAVAPTVPVTPSEPTTPNGNDPLDDIKDEKARSEAKKFRAIARRVDKKEDTPPAVAPTHSPTEFVKKDEFQILITNQAKELASPEVREAWNELLSIPLGGFNANDPRSIAENMADRYDLYKKKAANRPVNPMADLATTPGIRGSAPVVSPKQKQTDPPRLAIPTKPSEWYPKKS